MAVVDLEIDFLAEMQGIFRVVASDEDGFAVDKAVQFLSKSSSEG
jgi:hypothetical protein